MTDLEEAVLNSLNQGHQNATPGRVLAERLSLRGDRSVRLAIRSLIKQGHPVLSSVNPPCGYFLAGSIDEVKEHLEVLQSRIAADCTRYRDLRNGSSRLSGQQRLEI